MIYRGCFDNWLHGLVRHNYEGCAKQEYGHLGQPVEWCFCRGSDNRQKAPCNGATRDAIARISPAQFDIPPPGALAAMDRFAKSARGGGGGGEYYMAPAKGAGGYEAKGAGGYEAKGGFEIDVQYDGGWRLYSPPSL